MTEAWRQQVLPRFDGAASHYDGEANLQRVIAERLASLCMQQPISAGLWVDLGSGTGLLADALERQCPGQQVLRVDGSQAMLSQQGQQPSVLAFDLNNPLPHWPSPPTLLASSFVLHWLNDPAKTLQHWLNCLAVDGWIALSVPIEGSFPQWHQAAAGAGVACTAMPLPDRDNLLAGLQPSAIRYCAVLDVTQRAEHAVRLLKPMTTTGADSTPAQRLSAASWRRLFHAWPQDESSDRPGLTWKILILLLRR